MEEQVKEEIEIAVEAGKKKAAEEALIKDEVDQLVEPSELTVESGEKKVVEDALLNGKVNQLIEPPELKMKTANGQAGGSSSYPNKN